LTLQVLGTEDEKNSENIAKELERLEKLDIEARKKTMQTKKAKKKKRKNTSEGLENQEKEDNGYMQEKNSIIKEIKKKSKILNKQKN
jgi:hypothetical protein